MAIRNFILLTALALLSAACARVEYAPPPPTPQTLSVSYTPALGWIQSPLNTCASAMPQVALFVEENPPQVSSTAAIALRYGPLPEENTTGYAALLGMDTLVVIAHPDIPSGQLETLDVRQHYTSLMSEYTTFSYSTEDELRQAFDSLVLQGQRVSPHSLLAPNPAAVQQAISEGEEAIGYATQNWLNNFSGQSAPLTSPTGELLQLPILAITPEEPQGLTRLFVTCLESALP